MKQRRVCLASGYKYEYEGSARSWAASSDERWDTVMAKTICGLRLGQRRIDGALVTVVSARGKAYASQHVRTPGGGIHMMGPRRRRR